MPELGNFILLDASSPENVVVAKLAKDGRSWADFFCEKRPALEGIFPPLEKISQGMDAPGFLFCEGPGSILGIRIAAMVVRTKLALSLSNAPKVFAFQSLSLAARLILRAFPQKKTFSVVAGSRMGRLNVLSVSEGVPGPLPVCDGVSPSPLPTSWGISHKLQSNVWENDPSLKGLGPKAAEPPEECRGRMTGPLRRDATVSPISCRATYGRMTQTLARSGPTAPMAPERVLGADGYRRLPASLAGYSEIAKDELVGKVRGEVFTLPPVRNLPEGLEFSVLDAEELLRADPAVFAECPELLRDCGNTPDAVNTTTAESYAKWEPSRHGSGSGNT